MDLTQNPALMLRDYLLSIGKKPNEEQLQAMSDECGELVPCPPELTAPSSAIDHARRGEELRSEDDRT